MRSHNRQKEGWPVVERMIVPTFMKIRQVAQKFRSSEVGTEESRGWTHRQTVIFRNGFFRVTEKFLQNCVVAVTPRSRKEVTIRYTQSSKETVVPTQLGGAKFCQQTWVTR
jgi:hypothetical protein